MSTIADVATRAGVSKATASRALSGHGYVSEETRRRVAEAASELSYVAHSSATGRTQTVGVVMPPVDRWFFAELLAGIQTSLFALDYDLALYGVPEGSATRGRLFDSALPRRRFDGVIAVGIQPSARELERLQRSERPLVGIGPYRADASAVSIDDTAAARLAPAAPTMPGGYEAVVGLLGDRRSRPTAIVGVCDEAAIGAVIAARRLGIAVPTELSIVGIDDHEHAEMFALTTIRQPPREQGQEAVRLLIRRIEHPEAPVEHVMAASALVVRNSTAPPR